MKGREIAYGASSYLISYRNKIYLATAKHLTTSALGFEPPLNLKLYSDSSNYWKAFPRTNQLCADTVFTEDLHFYDNNLDDFILLEVNKKPASLGILKPNFQKLIKGTRVKILGCQYKDFDCFQKEYLGTFMKYTPEGEMEIVLDSGKIELAGFSGAPIVDAQNLVVGHLVSGSNIETEIIICYASPISCIKRILK